MRYVYGCAVLLPYVDHTGALNRSTFTFKGNVDRRRVRRTIRRNAKLALGLNISKRDLVWLTRHKLVRLMPYSEHAMEQLIRAVELSEDLYGEVAG